MTAPPHPDVATALTHLRNDEREHAERLLTESHRADPAEFRVTHTLALMTTWRLVDRVSSGRPVPDDDWRLCLGLWACLLADPAFWTWFAHDASRRYRAEVPPGDVNAVRERLERRLHETVTRCAGDNLAAVFDLEVRAARLVAVRGGVATGTAGRRIPCGPLLVDHLDLHQECRDLTAGLWASTDEQVRRTAQYFSQLGPARVLVDGNAPGAALAGLRDLRCPNCRTTASDEPAPLVCDRKCPDFRRLNPAYTHPGAGRLRLRADAVVLTVEAHLRVAEAAVSAREPDPATARQHWHALQALPEAAEPFRRHVTDVVLGRVRFLRRSRLDDAIALLEALPLNESTAADDRVSGEVARTLSTLLVQRGVDTANRGPADPTRAEADLRRAARLHPTSWHACRNFVGLLQSSAERAVVTPTPTAVGNAVTKLTEARDHLREHAGAFVGDEAAELVEQVSMSLAMMLNLQAKRAHLLGDHAEALRLVDLALAELPGDPALLRHRQTITTATHVPQERPKRDEHLESTLRRLDTLLDINPGNDELRTLRDELRKDSGHVPERPRPAPTVHHTPERSRRTFKVWLRDVCSAWFRR